MADYLDLRDLAEELQKLRDRRSDERDHLKDEHDVDIDTVVLQPDGQGDVPTWQDYHTACHEDAKPEHDHEDIAYWVDWLDDDDVERLKLLEDLDSELSDLDSYARNEPSAIPDSDWVSYCQQMAEDIGAISADAQWPLNRIDWDAAAEDLKADYTSFDFDGTEYWVRSY